MPRSKANSDKSTSILVFWVFLNPLGVAAQISGAGLPAAQAEQPDWDVWLTHFKGGHFYRQYNLIWDHREWCREEFNCRGPGHNVIQHQVCTHHWTADHGTNCRNYRNLKVFESEYERTRLLIAHNAFRDDVATHGLNSRFYGASNIRRMTWDYSLEDMATNWAVQCYPPEMKDMDCRRIQGFDYVSVLIGREEFPTNITSRSEAMLERWIESLTRYHYTHPEIQNLHKNFTHGPWDRGTQMLWHSSYKVGCGVVEFTSTKRDVLDKNENVTWYKVVVCYYAPPGNKVGQMIFQEGPPGICPEGTRTRYSCYGAAYPNLCHVADDPINVKIPRRTRSKETPPIPLYSHLVEATLTNAPATENTAPTETPAPAPSESGRHLLGHPLMEPIAHQESGGSELLASIVRVFQITGLALARQL